MSRVRALDVNGDWTFGKGQNDYKTQNQAVAQNVQTRLKSFLGNCYFDANAGIDWFNYLGSKDQVGLNLSVSAVILNTADIATLVQLSINLDPTTRRLSISYKATTDFGTTISNTVAFTPGVLITQGGDTLTTESGDSLLI